MKDLIEFLQQPAPEFPTLKFRFAKTMAETPHAYVVRTRANEGEYVKLFGVSTEHGGVGRFKHVTGTGMPVGSSTGG